MYVCMYVCVWYTASVCILFVCYTIYINSTCYIYALCIYRQDRLRALRFLDSVIAAPGKPSLLYSYTCVILYIHAIYISYYLYVLHAYVCVEGSRDYLFVERSLKEVRYILLLLCIIYISYILLPLCILAIYILYYS